MVQGLDRGISTGLSLDVPPHHHHHHRHRHHQQQQQHHQHAANEIRPRSGSGSGSGSGMRLHSGSKGHIDDDIINNNDNNDNNNDDSNGDIDNDNDNDDSSSCLRIEPGTLVKVLGLRKNKWRSAVVKRQHRSAIGLYKVMYRDGSVEAHVPNDRIAVNPCTYYSISSYISCPIFSYTYYHTSLYTYYSISSYTYRHTSSSYTSCRNTHNVLNYTYSITKHPLIPHHHVSY